MTSISWSQTLYRGSLHRQAEGDLFIDLLVRFHLIIEMIWWTGLAPGEFELPFPGSRISTFLEHASESNSCTRTEHVETPPAEDS